VHVQFGQSRDALFAAHPKRKEAVVDNPSSVAARVPPL
jgi:hypothetical protein